MRSSDNAGPGGCPRERGACEVCPRERGECEVCPRERGARERGARVSGPRMKVLIAGGGTGGHVFPGIAVAEELRAHFPQIDVLFIGGKRGLEATEVPEAGFALRTLATAGFARRRWWRWPWAAL